MPTLRGCADVQRCALDSTLLPVQVSQAMAQAVCGPQPANSHAADAAGASRAAALLPDARCTCKHVRCQPLRQTAAIPQQNCLGDLPRAGARTIMLLVLTGLGHDCVVHMLP